MKEVKLTGNYNEWMMLSEVNKFLSKLDKEDKLIFKLAFVDKKNNRYAGLFQNDDVIEKTIRGYIIINNNDVKIFIYKHAKDLAVSVEFNIDENENMYKDQVKMASDIITKYKIRHDKALIKDILSF
jgi:hypothetical protein